MAKTVWSFDLGKASIGEAVRDLDTNEFIPGARLLLNATKTGLSSGLCCFKKRLLLQVSRDWRGEKLPALLTLS